MTERHINAMTKDEARQEVVRLRGVLHACHDRLHSGKVDEAHEQLHCATKDAIPDTGNISLSDAARVVDFMHRFNALCVETNTQAAVVTMVPSVTKPGYHSIQLGGHVPTIQQVRHMMGLAPTHAARIG